MIGSQPLWLHLLTFARLSPTRMGLATIVSMEFTAVSLTMKLELTT